MKILSLCVALLTFSTVSFAETMTFGVVPQQSAKTLAAKWSPVLSHISDKAGIRLQFATAKDIPEFEKRVLAGEYDVAYMNPYHYVVFSQKPGYQAIAKQKGAMIRGILVARKDSSIQSLEDLQNTTLAFPSPAAFAASILPRAQMAQEKVVFTPKYVSSHDSVYLNVAKGFFPAGGGIIRTFNNTSPDVREQLKVLWQTKPYTSHAIAVHPRVSEQIQNKIVEAMLTMNEDPEAMKLLEALNFKGLEAASSERWDDIRGLNITQLNHLLND